MMSCLTSWSIRATNWPVFKGYPLLSLRKCTVKMKRKPFDKGIWKKVSSELNTYEENPRAGQVLRPWPLSAATLRAGKAK